MEWRPGDPGEPGALLDTFLHANGVVPGVSGGGGHVAVTVLLGAAGCAALAGLPLGAPSPVPAVPEIVAVAVQRSEVPAEPTARPVVGEWRTTWSDAEHAAAVERVRDAIARGDVYQANVVGHRSAPHRSRPADLARAAASIPGTYAGWLAGEGWAVGSASPEQLVQVRGRRITTEPIKGTSRIPAELLASEKDRAEHVMIVDLERNDLARVAVTGSVEVESLYDVAEWNGIWHAGSRVAAQLEEGVGVVDVLRAVAPGGSVTGAPKRAAVQLLHDLEPVGRGPAMGAFGFVWAGGMDLGLTIRTVAADEDTVHLWAGGGITWGSDGAAEVAEAHAKAEPVLRALGAAL
jgi:para-aminobenzoate synthetase component 1